MCCSVSTTLHIATTTTILSVSLQTWDSACLLILVRFPGVMRINRNEICTLIVVCWAYSVTVSFIQTYFIFKEIHKKCNLDYYSTLYYLSNSETNRLLQIYNSVALIISYDCGSQSLFEWTNVYVLDTSLVYYLSITVKLSKPFNVYVCWYIVH